MNNHIRHHHHSNNHHRAHNHQRNHQRAFVESTSSSINHHPYQQQQHPSGGSGDGGASGMDHRRIPRSYSISICYSYLIAILSSFLVVLGIYLALTRFNARFLYISAAGLLIEAIGALLFCISTIHKSRLAQRKQARTNDFPLDNEPIGNRQLPSRQQQARAVTHILTNRTLNNQTAIQIDNATINCHNVNESNGDLGPASVVVGHTNDSSPSDDNNEETHLENRLHHNLGNPKTSISTTDQATINNTTPEQSTNADQTTDPSPRDGEPLPNDDNDHSDCQSSPSVNQQLVSSQGFTQDEQQQLGPQVKDDKPRASIQVVQCGDNNDLQQAENPAQVNHEAAMKQPRVDRAPPSAGDHDETDLIRVQKQTPNSPKISIAREALEHTDELRAMSSGHKDDGHESSKDRMTQAQSSPSSSNSSPTAPPPPPPPPTASNRHLRPAIIRRTLVMGLDGEEEVVEIDEADLDNMSILPPPYESIATDNSNKQLERQARQ